MINFKEELLKFFQDQPSPKNWDEQLKFRRKEPNVEYAYILKSSAEPVLCSKNEFFTELARNEHIILVATPEHETYIVPGSDCTTLKPLIKLKKTTLKSNIMWALFWTLILGVFLMIASSDDSLSEFRVFKLYFIVFGIIPIAYNLFELWEIKKMKSGDYLKEIREHKFNYWLDSKTNYSVYCFTGFLIIIFVLQLFSGLTYSIDQVGLVKPETFNGKWYRIITSTLLHGNFIHVIFNAGALFYIGKMLVRLSSSYMLLIVFLVSGIFGSLFSLIFIPDITSVGSSGGIMGLIGFLLIFSLKFKDNVPRSLIKSMIISVILVAITGITAYEIIDNAAHFGGLIGGILVGLLLIKNKNTIPYKTSYTIQFAGIVSGLILLLGVIIIIYQLF